MSPEALPPLPDKNDPLLASFWVHCRQQQLTVQRCANCGTYRWFPRPACQKCWSFDTEWSPVSGRGTLYSWVRVHHPFTSAFVGRVPYDVVIVDLEEGVRFVAGIDGLDGGEPRIGSPVAVRFRQASDDIWLPYFVPDDDRPGHDRRAVAP